MILAPLVLLTLAVPLWEDEGPFRSLDFDAALVAAKEEQKVVMIDFFTTWCGPCKQLDMTTWKDPVVIEWLGRKTVPLKIDAEQEVELAKRYRIDAYPSMLFLRPDGTEMDRLVGYRAPETFLEHANDALAGRTAVTRAREALEGKENDPMLRGQLGTALARSGNYEEALAEFLWCWDHGLEYDRAYYGVRSSFLMSEIKLLARTYPAAREALVSRRDRQAEAVLAGTADVDGLRDLVTLNEQLGTREQILEVYDALLERGDPKGAAKELVASIASQLVKQHRYADVLRGVGNLSDWLEGEVEGIRSLTEIQEEADARGEAEADEDADEGGDALDDVVAELPDIRRMLVGRILTQAGPYYEALVGVDPALEPDQPTAAEFEDQVLAVDSSGRTFRRLIKHAIRAEAFDRARALLARAETTVTDERDLKRVRREARKIPDPEPSEGDA